jgi:hypothetical protein
MAYSNAPDVMQASGVTFEDLGFTEETEYAEWIDDRLEEISDLIDRRIAAKYQGAEAPAGIHGIARQMAVNLIANTVATRNSPTVRVDEWSVRVSQAPVWTDDIERWIELYEPRVPVRVFLVKSKTESEANG